MENSSKTQVSCILEPLHRLEASSDSIQDRKKLVEFFCVQVIPFIARYAPILPLLEKLRTDYRNLKDAIKAHENNAIAECKKAFRQIKRDLKARASLPDEAVLCLNEARSVFLKGQFRESQIYSDTVRDLLQLLLEVGFKDICAKHAELIEVGACIQIDLTQRPGWVLVNEQGKGKLFPFEGFSKSDALRNPNLIFHHPEMEHVKTAQIHFFTFDPSSEKAVAASKRVYWGQLHDPAVVWHYFESALWCWNTPSSYFEDRLSSSESQTEYVKWREISKLQGEVQDNNRIVVFTERLFKEGLKTLINAISVFIAEETYKVEALPKVIEEATFKLFWEREQLWISVESSAGKEELCIQKFKDFGYTEGSEPKKFCKKLVQVSPEIQVPYQMPFDRAAHVLDRLNLPPSLKRQYFGTAQKDSVIYQGPEIHLSLEAKDLASIIQDLRTIHNSN